MASTSWWGRGPRPACPVGIVLSALSCCPRGGSWVEPRAMWTILPVNLKIKVDSLVQLSLQRYSFDPHKLAYKFDPQANALTVHSPIFSIHLRCEKFDDGKNIMCGNVGLSRFFPSFFYERYILNMFKCMIFFT